VKDERDIFQRRESQWDFRGTTEGGWEKGAQEGVAGLGSILTMTEAQKGKEDPLLTKWVKTYERG